MALDHNRCKQSITYLVEPDPEEAANLKNSFKDSKREVNKLSISLWSEKVRLRLKLTKSLGASSVFEPNKDFLK